jgi:hypothetical protein
VEGFLEDRRATLAWKCEGLSKPRLKKVAVPRSNLTLLGPVQPMAAVGRSWPRITLAKERLP